MLDFSGAHWLEGYDDKYIADWKKKNDIRQVDHEDIYEIYNKSGDNRLRFINEGNIRFSPEAPGINLSAEIEPTDAQYARIRDFLRQSDAGSFYVDFEGKKSDKLTYSGNVNADRVINDMKHYYATGETRQQSSVAQFHSQYAIRDYQPAYLKEGMTAIRDRIVYIESKHYFSGSDFVKMLREHPEVNFIERIINGDKTAISDLQKTIDGVTDLATLDKLQYYPVNAFDTSYRKANRSAINKYNKVFREAVEKAMNAGKPVVGRNLGIKSGEITFEKAKELFYELNSDKGNKELADKVFAAISKYDRLVPEIKFKKIGSDPFNRTTYGEQAGDRIRYDTTFFNSEYLTDQEKANTILHEMIHQCTSYATLITLYKPQYASETTKNAVKALNEVWKEIRFDSEMRDANGKKFYGCNSADEMVAELSNPEFRIALQKKNLFQRVIDAIKSLLGIETTNAYDAASKALDTLLDNFDSRAFSEYMSMASLFGEYETKIYI